VFDWVFKYSAAEMCKHSEFFWLPETLGQSEVRLYAESNDKHTRFSIMHVRMMPFTKYSTLEVFAIDEDGEESKMDFKFEATQFGISWPDHKISNERDRIFNNKTEFWVLPKDRKGMRLVDGVSYKIRVTVAYENIVPASKHLERYKRMFENEQGADFVINVDGKQIKACKAILMNQSDYFTALIEANMSETARNEMNIDDFDHDVIKALIGYIYSESLEISSVDFAIELLAAADKYGVLELKDKCEEYVALNLTKELTSKVIILAKLHNATKAIKAVAVLEASNDGAKLPDNQNDGFNLEENPDDGNLHL